jgi:GTPase SAR1 family protein
MARRNNTISKKAIRLFRRLLSCRRSFRSIHRKIVMVGDAAVGKTALLSIHTAGTFPDVSIFTFYTRYELFNQCTNLSICIIFTIGSRTNYL